MPAALQVDWNEVKTLALAIGVREAARQMGLNENAVKQRSRREGWLSARHEAKAAMSPAAQAQRLAIAHGKPVTDVPVVPNASEVLSRMGTNTRARLASVADKAATTLDKLKPKQLLVPAMAEVAAKYTGMASKVHGWEQKEQSSNAGVVVNIALMGLTAEQARVEPIQDMPIAEA